MITDSFGRTFKTLRISLLNSCNFACVYCTEDGNSIKKIAEDTSVTLTHLLEIVEKLHKQLNLESIRLTGGEPLLYPELENLVKGLKEIGIPSVKMTTNGFMLQKQASKLKAAGLEEINVSLDAADEASFFKMTRRDKYRDVINGIDAALKANLKVKINSVIMKGMNHEQILPLLNFAFSKQITIRFLEVMSMGHLHQSADRYLFTQAEILQLIAEKYSFQPLPRKISSTANYWQTSAGSAFGIIANHSQPFCEDCNRLRLDQKGNIYGCLSSNLPISLFNIKDEAQLKEKLKKALAQKQQLQFTGSDLSMLAIGG